MEYAIIRVWKSKKNRRNINLLSALWQSKFEDETSDAIAIGHASLEVVNEEDRALSFYASHWPKDDVVILPFISVGSSNNTLQGDLESERGLPDLRIVLFHLDFLRLRERFYHIRDLKYEVSGGERDKSYSCSSILIDLLEAARFFEYNNLPRTHFVFSSPNSFYNILQEGERRERERDIKYKRLEQEMLDKFLQGFMSAAYSREQPLVKIKDYLVAQSPDYMLIYDKAIRVLEVSNAVEVEIRKCIIDAVSIKLLELIKADSIDVDAIETMLQEGASIQMKDEDGYTVIDWAEKRGLDAIQRLLNSYTKVVSLCEKDEIFNKNHLIAIIDDNGLPSSINLQNIKALNYREIETHMLHDAIKQNTGIETITQTAIDEWIAVGMSNGAVCIWKRQDEKWILDVTLREQHQDKAVKAMSFSPNSKLLAVSTYNSKIFIFELWEKKWQCKQKINLQSICLSLLFLDETNFVSANKRGQLIRWHLTKQFPEIEFIKEATVQNSRSSKRHDKDSRDKSAWIRSLVLLPGNRLAVASNDGFIRIWSTMHWDKLPCTILDSGNAVPANDNHNENRLRQLIYADNLMVSCIGSDYIRFWEVTSGTIKLRCEWRQQRQNNINATNLNSNGISTMNFMADGRLVCGTVQGEVLALEIDLDKSHITQSCSNSDLHKNELRGLAAVKGNILLSGDRNGMLCSWNLSPRALSYKDIKPLLKKLSANNCSTKLLLSGFMVNRENFFSLAKFSLNNEKIILDFDDDELNEALNELCNKFSSSVLLSRLGIHSVSNKNNNNAVAPFTSKENDFGQVPHSNKMS